MRIAVLGVPAQGHTNPTLPVVTELVRRGDEVVYFSTESFREAIERTGATFRPYVGLDAYDDRPMGDNAFRLATTVLDATARCLPTLLPALRRERPDLVVHDSMACWGVYAARVLDIPAICTVTTFAFSMRVLLLGDPPRLLDGLWSAVEAGRDLIRFRALGRELELTYGIAAPRLPDMFSNREPLNLVFTSREFQPFASDFDESFRFVGPSLRDEPITDLPLHGRSTLYVSLGTLFNERPDFYRACFEALAELDRRVVVSVGSRVDVEALGTPPGNFLVRRHVPQLQVLRRSALFVTHGGMNSVNEALCLRVPLVIFPQVADQLFVARRVEELGAGRVLRGRVDARALRRAVDAVLADPAYRRASERIADSLRRAGGYRRAADEIEAFAASTRLSGSGSRPVWGGIPSSR